MGRDVSGMDGAARRHQSLSILGDVFSGMWVAGWVLSLRCPIERWDGTTDDCVACAGRGQSQCCRPAVRRPGVPASLPSSFARARYATLFFLWVFWLRPAECGSLASGLLTSLHLSEQVRRPCCPALETGSLEFWSFNCISDIA